MAIRAAQGAGFRVGAQGLAPLLPARLSFILPGIGALTLGALIYVATYAKLTHTEYARQRLETDYRGALAENRRLLIQVGDRCSPSRVMARARDELNMRPYGPEEIKVIQPTRLLAAQETRASKAEQFSRICGDWTNQTIQTALSQARRRAVEMASAKPDQ